MALEIIFPKEDAPNPLPAVIKVGGECYELVGEDRDSVTDDWSDITSEHLNCEDCGSLKSVGYKECPPLSSSSASPLLCPVACGSCYVPVSLTVAGYTGFCAGLNGIYSFASAIGPCLWSYNNGFDTIILICNSTFWVCQQGFDPASTWVKDNTNNCPPLGSWTWSGAGICLPDAPTLIVT